MHPRLRLTDFAKPGEAFHFQNDLRTQRWGIGSHSHDFAEVFWIYRGEACHRVNGVCIDLKAGDVVFIRPRDEHSLSLADTPPLGIVNIAFPALRLIQLERRYSTDSRSWLWRAGKLPAVVHLELSRLEKLQEIADHLVDAPRAEFELDYFLLNCLHYCAAPIERESLPPSAPDWLAAACRRIHEIENLRDGVKAWVRLCGRGPEHVSRCTRQWLGMSPTDYVNRLRLEYIGQRLRTTSTPILDLALDAGFSNIGHFYKLFKSHHGRSPHQYRGTHRKAIV